ncbi:DoxX family membrane protein [Actinoplanes sp. NPDC051861]|uniref:DoxX family membrane protein n=1 Tax=Actinoplanes sp. NPDC051861 TaxID=3155170 RepID=UPI0034184E1A
MLTHAAARALAVLRIATGFVFLWAFLDKTFGLGWSTVSERAWINGGSPTKGFLSSIDVGPFADFFTSIAGAAWADWLFMLGLLGIGLALILGIGLRIAAVAAGLMMAFMWVAEWPLAQTTNSGEPTRSTNPVVDYHVIYGISAAVVALTYAGHTWGLGRWWAKLPFVRKNRWLI